jgi:hypothetical protein
MASPSGRKPTSSEANGIVWRSAYGNSTVLGVATGSLRHLRPGLKQRELCNEAWLERQGLPIVSSPELSRRRHRGRRLGCGSRESV